VAKYQRILLKLSGEVLAGQGSFAGFKDAAPGAELNGFFSKDRAAR